MSRSRSRIGFRSPFTVIFLAVLLTAGAALAQPHGAPDFDIRGARATTLQAPDKPLPPGQQRLLDDLRQSAEGELSVRWSPLTGAPSRLQRQGKPLTLPAKAAPQALASTFLARYRELFNLSPDDVKEMRFSRDFKTQHNNLTHLTLQQRFDGIEVFRGSLKLNVDAQGRILNISGEPIPSLRGKVNTATPSIDEAGAVAYAAEAAAVRNQRSAKVDGLVYFPRAADSVRLAWRVTVEDADSPNVYESLVDAADGTLLWRKNLTTYSHIPAKGLVFPSDDPFPDTPMGSLYTDSRDDLSFTGTGYFPHGDVHYDWWAGSTRDTSTSNNVDVYLDRDGNNAPDGACTSCGDGSARPSAIGEDFVSSLDLTLDPINNQDAALINLFYWNNHLHDWFYRLGFDEVAGNFQENNFGLGGSGSDSVNAEAQDAADVAPPGDGNCNANMSTPADGSNPRMQMYVCDSSTPERDTSLDNVVIAHEYSHGIHARLVPLSGRQNPQEGIADYFAQSIVAESTDPYGGAYGMFNYSLAPNSSGAGARSFPYSTDPAIFPRTYADINDASVCNVGNCSVTTGTTCTQNSDCPATESCQKVNACFFDEDCEPPVTTISRGPCTVGVHHTGELWANALWIARFNLVEKYGFTSGHRTMNQLVIDGMKLSPDDPSMLDGRDAILLADQTYYNGFYSCLLWDAFARMGMGYSALTTGNDDINPLEAFDLPAECTPVLQYNTVEEFGSVCIGDFRAETLSIFNTGDGELIISNVSRTAGSTDITVDATPVPPVLIGADAHVDFTVRCTPTTAGAKTATITVATNDPTQPTVDIEYTCTGGEADIDTALLGSNNYGDVCIGTTRTTAMTIHNSGTCPLRINSVTSSAADFVVGAVTAPLEIEPGDNIQIPLEFRPVNGGPTGAKAADITISSNDPQTPSVVLALTGNAPTADAVAFIANSGAFGNVCADTIKDLELTIQNNGLCPLSITAVSLVGGDAADFSLPNGFAPVILESLNSVVMPVRFAPDVFTPPGPARSTTARVTNRTAYSSDATVDDDTGVSGTVPPPDINVPANTGNDPEVEFGNVCGGEIAEKEIPVCNTGLCTLNVTGATLSDGAAGACDDFTIVQNPFPSEVSHDFCMSIVVRYTPTEEGEHSCVLTITSDDPDESPIDITLHGTTPDSIIDIPGDLTYLPEVVQTIDQCSTLKPYPISNNGICPLEITDISISENADEYGLDGLPSFPIILQTGHIAGEGDLDVVFAPDEPLEREKTGKISVTYINDAILRTTETVEHDLCGEGVLTGARVLVTQGGSPVSQVERIQIQRITANRNRRPQLDTVSVLQNVPLHQQTGSIDACPSFYWHSEYGTVTNPNQLLPGVYQVNATIRINGRRYTKSVGFSVGACDFNPTVVVTFP